LYQSIDRFPIQKWTAVFIRYHKRAHCGKHDRQQAEIFGENETPMDYAG
jgi:hypothetical protein